MYIYITSRRVYTPEQKVAKVIQQDREEGGEARLRVAAPFLQEMELWDSGLSVH